MIKGTSVLRARNEKRVLKYLRQHKTSSRQEMVEALSLSKNTISMIVESLLREQMVVETGASSSGVGSASVGRPRIELTLVPGAGQAVGILIRSTHFEVIITDYVGNQLESRIVKVNASDSALCVRALADVCSALLAAYPHILGIGLAVPGVVDPLHGIVRQSTHLGWNSVPIVQSLRQACGGILKGIPVLLLNRVKAAAMSPFGVIPENADSVFYLRIDEGVGGAFMKANEILQGANWTAGEIGHIVVNPDGPGCTCGQKGCLEQLVSLRSLREAYKTKNKDKGHEPGEAHEHEAHVGKAQEGESSAARLDLELGEMIRNVDAQPGSWLGQILADMGNYVGLALASVVALLNPQFVVIDSPYNKVSAFRHSVISAIRQRTLAFPIDESHIKFVNPVHASAIGMALSVVLHFEEEV